MEAICSSETSARFQRTTRRYILEDSTFHNHRCGNLKSMNILAKKIRTFHKDLKYEIKIFSKTAPTNLIEFH
jgi:hypothetical protein